MNKKTTTSLHAGIVLVVAFICMTPLVHTFAYASPTELHIDLTVFLEGPYDGTEMTTDLNGQGFLPLDQPYDTNSNATWYYEGTESVISIPNTDVVDWMLVELRDALSAACATPATIIARQAAFLLKDGSIVDVDGASNVVFDATISNNLYVVLYHRNHLGVISAVPLIESGGVYQYDFTTSVTQAYGGSTAQKEIAPGVWGLFAADVNGDEQVNNNDKFLWYYYAGQSGYHACDINLDGQVNNPDKPRIEDYWNFGRGSQIPQSLTLHLKVLLEGPFVGTAMTTPLNAGGYLPLSQPYNTNPTALWFYNGAESVSSIPRADIVDWILIELRDAPQANLATKGSILKQQAGFLLKDGTVIGTDGSNNIKFNVPLQYNLFVCLYHRNHVPVMSAIALTCLGGSYNYDFTIGVGQTYGGITAHKTLGLSGLWGMFACDSNGDGQVNFKDNKGDIVPLKEELGESGYLPHDWNLDGQVNNQDKLDTRWPQNAGRGTQIPGYSKTTSSL